MHRTQILLNDNQYVALCEKSRRTGKSIGSLIRELVDHGFKKPNAEIKTQRSALQRHKGVFRGPPLRGRDHDDMLY